MMVQNNIVVLCLCLLYFLQGIPYGLQIKALPLYFYQVLEFPINTVTKLSLLMTPWIVLKPLIANYLKSSASISWFVYAGILGNIVFNFTLYIIMPSQHNTSSNIQAISLVLFLINCSTVVIDVASDRLAIASATSSDDLKFMGISNSIQVVAYKFGSMFGVFLINYLGYNNIKILFVVLATFYLASLCVVFIMFQALNFAPKEQKSNAIFNTPSPRKPVKLFNNLKSILSVPGTFYLIVFVLSYKLGEVGTGSLFQIFLLQKGVSKETVSYITTTFSEPLSLCGSFIGGFIWRIYQPVNPTLSLIFLLSSIGCLRVLPLGVQYLILTDKPGFFEISGSVGLLSLMGGIISTLTFTLMMTLSYKAEEQYQASHYALLSSIEVFGKLLFSAYIGTISSYLSLFQVYAMFCMFTVFSSIWLFAYKHSLNCNVINPNKLK